MSHLTTFSIFNPIKIDLSGDTVLPEAYNNSPKLTLFGIFNQLLSTQNVARFARNVQWDFFCDFQTLCNLGDDMLSEKIQSPNNVLCVCVTPFLGGGKSHTKNPI